MGHQRGLSLDSRMEPRFRKGGQSQWMGKRLGTFALRQRKNGTNTSQTHGLAFRITYGPSFCPANSRSLAVRPMAQRIHQHKKKPRTPERPGEVESRGIFFWKQGGRAGPLCFFVHVQPPRPSGSAKPDGQQNPNQAALLMAGV